MTATEYAKKAGVHRATVYRWLQKEGNAGEGGCAMESYWNNLRRTHARNGGYAVQKAPKEKAPVERDPVEASLSKELALEQRRARKLEEELGDRKRLESAILSKVPALPVPRISYQPRKRKGKSQATPVIGLADLHTGHAEAPVPLVERKLAYLRQQFGDFVEDQRSSYTLEDVHVFGLGDYVEGGLRESALQTITSQEPEQAVEAGNLISQFCMDLASQFRKVYLSLVLIDNHGRIDKKMNFEQAFSRSWNFVVESMIQARLRGHKQIEINAPHDFACWVKVENTRFLNIHGNGIRMYRRTPYYGIDDRTAEEKANRQGTATEFDRLNLGHFHHKATGKHWHLHPSLCPTTGFDRASGRVTQSAQLAYLVSPKHLSPFCEVTFDLESIT